jgi:uncharacterized protein YbjT (DUF2867 family)
VILLVGGTGTLGRHVAARLIGTGSPVRVLTRDAAHADGLAADVTIGDLRDPTAVAAAVAGCSTVVSAAHGFLGGRGAGPTAIDDRGNAALIDASVEAGVQHFVLLSVLGARPDHPMSLHRAKYAAEQHLYASGLDWTVLRPSAYLETWTEVIGAKLSAGGPAIVFGRGTNPINFVSVRDVTALVEAAITDSTLRNKEIDVVGPENLGMVEFAELLGATKIRHIPRGVLRILAKAAAPVAPVFARQAAAAIVMDTTDMTADPSSLHRRFPEMTWHRLTDLAGHSAAPKKDLRSDSRSLGDVT